MEPQAHIQAEDSDSSIPLWHFRMLSDVARNDAFDSALNAVVDDNSVVLDIGTGSGLLAMMAARAGAAEVHAIEEDEELATIAQSIITQNGYSDQITLHRKNSSEVRIGSDLPSKANVLVSEILDAGLLGEGVLPTFRHALEHLTTDNVQVIPAAAQLRGILVQCDEMASVSPVRDISGFDLSEFNQLRGDEDYEPFNLKNENHEQLSDELLLSTLDFKNLPPIAHQSNPHCEVLKAKITEDGVLHGIAFWFDLNVDERNVVSSGPDGEMISWGQVIQLFVEPKPVSAGEIIQLAVLQSETLYRFEIQ